VPSIIVEKHKLLLAGTKRSVVKADAITRLMERGYRVKVRLLSCPILCSCFFSLQVLIETTLIYTDLYHLLRTGSLPLLVHYD
jgi:hypothetical protein